MSEYINHEDIPVGGVVLLSNGYIWKKIETEKWVVVKEAEIKLLGDGVSNYVWGIVKILETPKPKLKNNWSELLV